MKHVLLVILVIMMMCGLSLVTFAYQGQVAVSNQEKAIVSPNQTQFDSPPDITGYVPAHFIVEMTDKQIQAKHYQNVDAVKWKAVMDLVATYQPKHMVYADIGSLDVATAMMTLGYFSGTTDPLDAVGTLDVGMNKSSTRQSLVSIYTDIEKTGQAVAMDIVDPTRQSYIFSDYTAKMAQMMMLANIQTNKLASDFSQVNTNIESMSAKAPQMGTDQSGIEAVLPEQTKANQGGTASRSVMVFNGSQTIIDADAEVSYVVIGNTAEKMVRFAIAA